MCFTENVTFPFPTAISLRSILTILLEMYHCSPRARARISSIFAVTLDIARVYFA